MDFSSLSFDESMRWWRSVACLPIAPETQQSILSSLHSMLAEALLWNTCVQRHLVEELVEHGNALTCKAVASVYQDESVHLRLCRERFPDLAWELAQHTTFPSVLDELIAVDEPTLHELVAQNENATLDQLRRLSLRPDPVVGDLLVKGRAFTVEDLDASWGSYFLLSWFPDIAAALLGSRRLDEVWSLGTTWHGSLADLLEAFSLVER